VSCDLFLCISCLKESSFETRVKVATDIILVCYTFILAVKITVKISVWLGQNCLKVSELWDLYFSLTYLKMRAEISHYFMLENVFLRGFNFIILIMVTYMSNRSDIYPTNLYPFRVQNTLLIL